MKSLSTLFTLVIIAFSVIAYSEPSTEISSAEHEQHTIEASSSNIAASEIAGMTLNNGEKWQLDEHTRSSLISMNDSVTFENINTAATANLKTLGTNLQAQLNDLIQGCTMVGGDHDQLHTFLTGYIPAVDNLTETGSIESAKKIEYYLNNYKHYFQ